MKAKNENAIMRILSEAQEAGIPAALITDLGYYGVSEELLGKETVTAIGLGPARRDEVAAILKRARMME